MADDQNNGEDGGTPVPESLLPYDEWTEEALRHVAVRALSYVAENGLPGDHHFYLTFRTDAPGVVLPPRLKAQYPREMTVVLQHQFWDMAVEDSVLTVGLSFGGVPATLRIPIASLTGFADPHVRYGLRFRAAPGEAEAAAVHHEPAEVPEPPTTEVPEPDATPQVVSLDAFRRKTAPKEGA